MNGTTYEVATWYEIESNKMHLKKDGEHYVADAILFRDNLNLRQENESLRKENDKLLKEIDRLVTNTLPTSAELRRVRAEWKKDRDENAELRGLVRRYGEYIGQDRCEGCVCKSKCNNGDVDECWQLTEIRELACELGIEVDE